MALPGREGPARRRAGGAWARDPPGASPGRRARARASRATRAASSSGPAPPAARRASPAGRPRAARGRRRWRAARARSRPTDRRGPRSPPSPPAAPPPAAAPRRAAARAAGAARTPLRGDLAIVVSTAAPRSWTAAVAMDLSVAYLGAERMNHPFRVIESVLLRVLAPGRDLHPRHLHPRSRGASLRQPRRQEKPSSPGVPERASTDGSRRRNPGAAESLP